MANFGCGITRHFLQIPACVNCELGPGMLLERKICMLMDAFVILNIQKCYSIYYFYQIYMHSEMKSSRRVIPNHIITLCSCLYVVRTMKTKIRLRVSLAQLREQLRHLFRTKLCQTAFQNSCAGKSPRYPRLWSSSARAKLQKGTFPRFVLPFAKAAPRGARGEVVVGGG
jgi:hypothetical protein